MILGAGTARAETFAVSASSAQVMFTPKPRQSEAPLGGEGRRKNPEAWTKGSFRINYVLAPAGAVIKADNVRVKIKNTIFLPKNASQALIEHESVHQRINEVEAARIQKEMAAFERPYKDWRDLAGAEKDFKKMFYDKVRSVNELHKNWDGTHKLKHSR
jgi:hypothetical protein